PPPAGRASPSRPLSKPQGLRCLSSPSASANGPSLQSPTSLHAATSSTRRGGYGFPETAGSAFPFLPTPYTGSGKNGKSHSSHSGRNGKNGKPPIHANRRDAVHPQGRDTNDARQMARAAPAMR